MNYAMTYNSPWPSRAKRRHHRFLAMTEASDRRGGRGRGHRGPESLFGPGFGGPPRGGFGGGRGSRRDRGDVRAAILLLLDEQPRHGYEIITEITDRSEGTWRLSPGSVYPVLKSLTKKGLVRPEQQDGKKVFHLTDSGKQFVAERRERWGEPWTPQEQVDNEALTALWNEARQLAMSVWQVADGGDEAQQQAVAEVLADTKRKVYLTLAGDTPTTE